jgi:hypothetical protein
LARRWRGHLALKRSPTPTGIGCAPTRLSRNLVRARIRANPASLMNPETAVVMAAKQRRSSVGAAFRAILATAEQFQIGARPPLKLFNHDSDLVRLAAVNCGF